MLQKLLILIKFQKIAHNNQADDIGNSAHKDYWA